MKFWLGTHQPQWLAFERDLFVSRRRLTGRKTYPVAAGQWALDSGGFTELNLYGHWQTTEDEYVRDVLLFEREIGNLAWVAPQDWMCEPFVIEKTGGSVAVHQQMTVENFLRLRDRLGELVIPVLQGWTRDDYQNCWGLYEEMGVDLAAEPLVGVGSICRRQNTETVEDIILSLSGLNLHGFGVKKAGIAAYGDLLTSADSLAWSYTARRADPLPGCTKHINCANCIHYARLWRELVEAIQPPPTRQTRMEFA